MNIICNNCVGARIYELLQVLYNNPFMWNVINVNDYLYIIENFDNMDFSNFNTILENYNNNHDRVSAKIIVDNNISLHYIHYVQDESYESITKASPNIFYKDILDYASNKYMLRLNRMVEQPVFLYTFSNLKKQEDSYYINIITKFNNLITNYDIYILKPEYIKIDTKLSDNIHLIDLTEHLLFSDTTASIAKFLITNNFLNL